MPELSTGLLLGYAVGCIIGGSVYSVIEGAN